jgi:glycosyltransferase involved in cell wall biosynthesis
MFTTLFPPYTGGAAADAELLVPKLALVPEIRHVFVVTEYYTGSLVERGPGYTILRILPRRDSIDRRKRTFDLVRFACGHLVILLVLCALGVAARRHVIHMHGRLIYRWNAILVDLLRLRAIADVRDLFGDPQRYKWFPAATGVSEAIVLRLYGVLEKSLVTYIPVPIDPLEITASSTVTPQVEAIIRSRQFILFVGTLSENKGIRELVEAHKRYRARGGRADLVVVGENRLEGGALGTDENVHVLGSLARPVVYALMRAADRVVLPSRSEGLPRVCIEAIVVGCAVVCPPGIAEFDRFCPQCVLPAIEPEAIVDMLLRPREELFATGFPTERMNVASVVRETVAVMHRVQVRS